MYGVPTKRNSANDEYEINNTPGVYRYQGKTDRPLNKKKDGSVIDPRRGAPRQVYYNKVDYDKNSENYLQNKYELNLNDGDDDNIENHGAWFGTEEPARKFASFLKAAFDFFQMKGVRTPFNFDNVYNAYRNAIYTVQKAKNDFSVITGVHPNMIENFLMGAGSKAFGGGREYRQVVTNKFNYQDAKMTKKCIITPDGEEEILPNTEYSGKIIGPSLKSIGFPDLSNEELSEVVDDFFVWSDEWEDLLVEQENALKQYLPIIEHMRKCENKNVSYVATYWYSLLEEITGMLSLSAIPAEVMNKREEASDLLAKQRRNYDSSGGGLEPVDTSGVRNIKKNLTTYNRDTMLNEEMTKLNVFGKHPGYRKKPMTHPDNTEVAPNGARDWNDDSAKGEEPFGKQIGSSAPYTDKVVNILTDMVYSRVKKMISEDVDEKTFLRLPQQQQPEPPMPDPSMPEAQAADPNAISDAGMMPGDPAMGGAPDQMGGDPNAMGAAPGGEENPFGGNFDAGVQADEDTDPEEFIQQLTGKLSQSLKDYDEQNPGNLDLDKYVIGMIVKQAVKGMDEGERKKVIKKIKETPLPGDDQMEDASTEGVADDPELDAPEEQPQEGPMPEPGQEEQPMNERRSLKMTKKQFMKLCEAINNTEDSEDRRDSDYSKYVKMNRRTYPFIPPQFK